MEHEEAQIDAHRTAAISPNFSLEYIHHLKTGFQKRALSCKSLFGRTYWALYTRNLFIVKTRSLYPNKNILAEPDVTTSWSLHGAHIVQPLTKQTWSSAKLHFAGSAIRHFLFLWCIRFNSATLIWLNCDVDILLSYLRFQLFHQLGRGKNLKN